MPASSTTERTPLSLGEALDTLTHERAVCAQRESQARTILMRAAHQLSQWQWKYGKHNPDWLPPSGDVELMLDIDDWIEGK